MIKLLFAINISGCGATGGGCFLQARECVTISFKKSSFPAYDTRGFSPLWLFSPPKKERVAPPRKLTARSNESGSISRSRFSFPPSTMLTKVTMALLSVVSLLASPSPSPPQSSSLDDRLRSLNRRLECLRSGEEPGFTGPPAVAQVNWRRQQVDLFASADKSKLDVTCWRGFFPLGSWKRSYTFD